jgi:transposase-like protein
MSAPAARKRRSRIQGVEAQRPRGTFYRVDETCFKVGKQFKYLYRAVDKQGNTIEFMLSAKRPRFCGKTIL